MDRFLILFFDLIDLRNASSNIAQRDYHVGSQSSQKTYAKFPESFAGRARIEFSFREKGFSKNQKSFSH
jgi:hypothetical protein